MKPQDCVYWTINNNDLDEKLKNEFCYKGYKIDIENNMIKLI